MTTTPALTTSSGDLPSSIPAATRAWFLEQRPTGQPTTSDFAIREVPLADLEDGQILVVNEFLSVDPYMRGRMSAKKSYIDPYEVGAAMDGPAVGRVLASRADGFRAGDHVFHGLGWREHAVLDAAAVFKVDPTLAPLSTYLGVLGVTGVTAYIGIERFAEISDGETVYVSGAAGAVGSVAGQIAKLKGAGRVIGSAGSDEKVAQLVEQFGFDAAFNYKTRPIAEQLAEAAPEGIDVFFDNVGGEALEAAIGALNIHARVVLSGMVSQYNDEPVTGPRNLWNLSVTRSKLVTFMVTEELDLQPRFLEEAAGWLATGELRSQETTVEGFENTLDAYFAMMRGENTGKMIVRL
ncbi:NADP-dependent oxidoreductase [Aeromicrobium ginsengisoli]|uniref:NADP-dependent oxidoreductase n=1 Tax=Aeromicrobium ginsengisoli TaxID=363867 RepID=A0A5M4FF07_9ACTN|nr:NADP-dependent oxidoreductase [Aeromicrobium ginsengisoli]KAA1397790.1 NADP-dependent oxidoreductase [Aeromicrobium ginsengisoli]